MALVGTREINNRECEMHADQYGRWHIKLDGKSIGHHEESLDKAVAAARQSIKKMQVKVEVPFISLAGVKGVATGFHTRNGSILVRMDGDDNSPLDRNVIAFKPDTPQDVVDRYWENEKEQQALKTESRKILEEHGFGGGNYGGRRLYYAVERAIEEAVKAQDAAGADKLRKMRA